MAMQLQGQRQALYNSLFHCRLRGLPWWYQLLMGAAAALAVGGLWLTCLADPGAIPAAHEPGEASSVTAGTGWSVTVQVGAIC